MRALALLADEPLDLLGGTVAVREAARARWDPPATIPRAPVRPPARRPAAPAIFAPGNVAPRPPGGFETEKYILSRRGYQALRTKGRKAAAFFTS